MEHKSRRGILTPEGRAGRTPFGEVRVKYFGRELPPRCELHKCYLTDDGTHFYCTNFSCNKHKFRRTKHTKYSRYAHLDTTRRHGTAPARAEAAAFEPRADEQGFWPVLHFKCPVCKSADIDMRIVENQYVCHACEYTWR